MMKIKYLSVGMLIVCMTFFAIYINGPEVSIEYMDTLLPEVPNDFYKLEKMVKHREDSYKDRLKSGNEALIVWADAIPAKTEYSIVYLHGWSASREEGAPLHLEIAKKYHCNLYLPRLSHHGLKGPDSMKGLTTKKLIDSAKEAVAIATKIGEKVIIMATSTGASIALYLASENQDIAGLVLYSPNIEIYTSAAKLLSGPWGLELARVLNGDYFEFEADENRQKFWTHKYNVEALPQLQVLLDHTMNIDTFKKVKQPVFLGYYYKNEDEQDKVVSVPAMLRMFRHLGTPGSLKYKKAFPDSGHHVIASHLLSKDLTGVKKETFYFLENILGLRPSKP